MNNRLKIIPLPILKDNYVWILVDETTQSAVIVDPGEAAPVANYLDKHQLKLLAILITHRHWDHTNGVLALKDKYPAPVYGPVNDPVDGVSHTVHEGDKLHIDNFPVTFTVLDIPAHTRGHIAYVGAGGVFCGDTLFSAGCGRLFEGTPEQMVAALTKLAALPDDTKVYCAHEYTLHNLKFAKIVEPGNNNITNYREHVESLLHDKKISLPSTIKIEKEVNPFLRCSSPEIIASVENFAGQTLKNQIDVFKFLREWKDEF